MKNNNAYIAHFCNNMHADLFERLHDIQIFDDNTAVFKFIVLQDLYMVPQTVEPIRSVIELSDTDINAKFDVILTNDTSSDIEIIQFEQESKPVKKILLHEPEFISSGVYCFDYEFLKPNANVLTYKAKFKSLEEKEI